MPRSLSSVATVSLITCAPGTETYALFGHSALRVADPLQGVDRVYNYGTFDFTTPNFYGRFLRGDLRYFLSVTSFAAFHATYQADRRSLTEQVLALQPQETQRVYDQLETTLASPARYYRYQFFADNCTTRLYDLVMGSVQVPVRIDSTYVPVGQTYRELLAPFLAPAPWVKLGMNLGLGWPADQPTTFRQRLFLPIELFNAWAHARRQDHPFVAHTRPLVVVPSPALDDSPQGYSPALVFGSVGLLLLLTACLPARYALLCTGLSRAIAAAVGLTGCLLLGLHLFSLHTPAHYNYQLLWLLPTHLGLAVARPSPGWRRYATVSVGLLLVGSLLGYSIYYAQLLPEVGWLLILVLGQLLLLRHHFQLPKHTDTVETPRAN